MILDHLKEKTILQDLGDGLVLRRATPDDTEALVTFDAIIHSDDGPDKPDLRVGAWVRDLMTLPHPTFRPDDFTIVEDTRTGAIVSSMNLISQTWSYGGIPFGVGRPELVGTLPEYRNRGLIRKQFDVVHAWSAERGELVQGITGIPYYYRLFGYEMALNLGGGRAGYNLHVPKLKDGEAEPYRIRPAGEADLPLIARLYEQACRRQPVSVVFDDALWQYELSGRSEHNINRYELRVIESEAGEAVGYLAHPPVHWKDILVAGAYELLPGVSMAAVTPTVIRYLWTLGEKLSSAAGKRDEFGAFGFWMGAEHPVYGVLGRSLPNVRKPYAWYLRVADLPAFIRRIAPALERRLAASPIAGHTADIRITFYRDGLHLALENGRFTAIEPYRPTPVGHEGEAAFPGLTFLQLLFGYRSLDELAYAFADCWTKDETVACLLNNLFPKQASDLWPVG